MDNLLESLQLLSKENETEKINIIHYLNSIIQVPDELPTIDSNETAKNNYITDLCKYQQQVYIKLTEIKFELKKFSSGHEIPKLKKNLPPKTEDEFETMDIKTLKDRASELMSKKYPSYEYSSPSSRPSSVFENYADGYTNISNIKSINKQGSAILSPHSSSPTEVNSNKFCSVLPTKEIFKIPEHNNSDLHHCSNQANVNSPICESQTVLQLIKSLLNLKDDNVDYLRHRLTSSSSRNSYSETNDNSYLPQEECILKIGSVADSDDRINYPELTHNESICDKDNDSANIEYDSNRIPVIGDYASSLEDQQDLKDSIEYIPKYIDAIKSSSPNKSTHCTETNPDLGCELINNPEETSSIPRQSDPINYEQENYDTDNEENKEQPISAVSSPEKVSVTIMKTDDQNRDSLNATENSGTCLSDNKIEITHVEELRKEESTDKSFSNAKESDICSIEREFPKPEKTQSIGRLYMDELKSEGSLEISLPTTKKSGDCVSRQGQEKTETHEKYENNCLATHEDTDTYHSKDDVEKSDLEKGSMDMNLSTIKDMDDYSIKKTDTNPKSSSRSTDSTGLPIVKVELLDTVGGIEDLISNFNISGNITVIESNFTQNDQRRLNSLASQRIDELSEEKVDVGEWLELNNKSKEHIIHSANASGITMFDKHLTYDTDSSLERYDESDPTNQYYLENYTVDELHHKNSGERQSVNRIGITDLSIENIKIHNTIEKLKKMNNDTTSNDRLGRSGKTENTETTVYSAIEKISKLGFFNKQERAQSNRKVAFIPDVKLRPSKVNLKTDSEKLKDIKAVQRQLESPVMLDQPEIEDIPSLNLDVIYHEIRERYLPKLFTNCVFSHIESPSEFYIHLDDEESVLLDSLNEQIADTFQKTKCPYKSKGDAYKNLGRYCCAYVEEYKTWNRVEIIDWRLLESRKLVDVQLVDYGNICCIGYKYLRNLTRELSLMPKIAIKCYLPMLYPPESTRYNLLYKWPKSTIKALIDLSGLFDVKDHCVVYKIIYVQQEDDFVGIDMYALGDNEVDTIGQLLMNLGHAVQILLPDDDPNGVLEEDEITALEHCDNINEVVVGYDSKDEARICKFTKKDGSCFKGKNCKQEHVQYVEGGYTTDKLLVHKQCQNSIKLPFEGDCISIRFTVVLNACHYYININNNYNALSNLETMMNKKETSKTYQSFKVAPAIGELVVVKHWDKRWLRGRVKHHVYEEEYCKTLQVFMVDYGDIIDVSLSDVRQIPEAFLHLPFQAVECILHNFKAKNDVSPQIIEEFFHKKMVFRDFAAFVMGVSDTLLCLSIYHQEVNIGETLKSMGFVSEVSTIQFPTSNSRILPG